MITKNNKHSRSISEKNKDIINNKIKDVKPSLVYQDVLVLEVLERNDKSKFIQNYVCKNSLEFVCAYSKLHGKYFAHKIDYWNDSFLRTNFGSNKNITGREFRLESKNFSETEIKKGKILLNPTVSENESKQKNSNTDVFFSLGNFNLTGGLFSDRSEWKFIDPTAEIGYIINDYIPLKKN